MSSAPIPPQTPRSGPSQTKNSWWVQKSPLFIFFVALFGVSVVLAWGLQSVGKKVIASFASQATLPENHSSAASKPSADSTQQAEAEALLQKVAAGDDSAAQRVLDESDSWTGKTQRTSNADQLLNVSLNSNNMHARQASLQAELAMDGVQRSEAGLDRLEPALKDPSQRRWALWMTGAVGNRGIDPMRAAIMISTYLQNPDVNTRVAAVDALSLLGTDATIPLVLDRFYNDSSPAVQERAACGLAQSGMYTHEQRMTAATRIIPWLDNPKLSAQQHAWVLQALRDISGKNLGLDSAAWQNWLDSPQQAN
jgi:HEAT repeat protein